MVAEEIKNTINSVFVKNGVSPIIDFEFGEFVDMPNKRGVFQINKLWFIYESDERNVKSISGPFADKDIIFACAKILHSSKLFEEYRFSNEAKSLYIHSHFRSLKEAEDSI